MTDLHPAAATLKLPRFSPAAVQFFAHVAIVFLVAFGGQMIPSLTGTISMPALLAVLTSAAAAGLTAVVHYLLGLVPSGSVPAVDNGDGSFTAVAGLSGVPLAVRNRLYQVLISIVVTFLSIFGSGLVAGGLHVTSFPGIVDAITAAIAAGVAGVIQFAVGLIPASVTA